MRGGYDLYGNYYPSRQAALEAEMEQMDEIDARYAYNKSLEPSNDEMLRAYEEDLRREYEEELDREHEEYMKLQNQK